MRSIIDPRALSSDENRLAQERWIKVSGASRLPSDDELNSTEFTVERDDPAEMSLPRGHMTFEGVLGLLAAFFIGLPSPILGGVAIAHLIPLPGNWLGWLVFFGTGYLSLLVVNLAARATEGDGNRLRFSGRLVSSNRMSEFVESSDEMPDELLNSDDSEEVTIVTPATIPLAIAMAVRLPAWPLLLRPAIGLWWLGHFATAAFLGHHIGAHSLQGVNAVNLFVAVPFTLGATFAFLFAGNLYLMLAVATIIKKPKIWLTVWQNRYFVDFVIAAILLLAAK